MRDIQSKKNDYYAVLSVERTATDSEIKKAYRKLAVKIHPDKCQGTGAEEAFKIVSKAFACLSDSEKRAAYDRYGSEEGPQGMPGCEEDTRARRIRHLVDSMKISIRENFLTCSSAAGCRGV